MKKLLVFLVVALAAVSALPAFAFKADGNREALNDVLVEGADLHLSRQETYDNACGDSYGPPVVDEIDNTWEWQIDSGWTCWNVGGISATGLLAAYERTRDSAYLSAALLTGDTLVEKYSAIAIHDPEGAEWEDRPFSQDIEFLVRLSRDSGDRSYSSLAAEWYSIISDKMTAVDNADRYIEARCSLAGWDLASQIRAAVAVGDRDYARGMANRLLERRDDWEGVLLGGSDYTMSSYASLLWAFHDIGGSGRDVSAAIAEFRGLVLDAQEEDGSWDEGDYQTVAYAILGLDAVQRNVRTALGKAFAFLRDTQTTQGGWTYPLDGELGEVNSEVLMALASLQQLDEGQDLDDPAPGDPARPTAVPTN